jgi:hypothetical protein
MGLKDGILDSAAALLMLRHLLGYELNWQRNVGINGCNCRGIAVMYVQSGVGLVSVTFA